MNFAEELRRLSTSASLEERVWELIKPYLREIASNDHPKGCHVVFEGVSKSFANEMKKIIKNEDIYFDYVYPTDNSHYGYIIWEKCNFWNGVCLGQRDMSDKVLRVELTKSGQISINIEKLEEKYRNIYLYTYIS